MNITVNAGETVKYFWKGTVTAVVVAEAFEAKVVGYDEANKKATIEYAASPNGKAWVAVG